MQMPTLFRDRPRPVQIVLGGCVPFAFGAVVGIVLGVSAGAYWGLSVLAGPGRRCWPASSTRTGGAEPTGGWSAERCSGSGVLVAHAIAGTDAKVSLGGFPPLLIVIDAIFGMLLGALGGRLARGIRERQAVVGKPA